MKQFLTGLCLLGLVVAISSCGESTFNDGEDFGDLLDTPDGLVLTEEEHIGGWGRADCTACHNLENIHLVNRSDIPIDIEAVHEEALEEGIDSCADCHGTNGVL